MTNGSILLADDLTNTSAMGRSRSHLIRDLAAEFSRRLNLPLQILYVANSKNPHLTNAQTEKIKARDDEVLANLKDEMSHYPVRTKITVAKGEPISIILNQAKKNVEMVVLGSQGKRGLYKALIGSVSEEIVRNSPVPVLVLGPEARNLRFELPTEDPLRILLLTDLSSASQHAEEFAFSLCSRLKAKLTICHSAGERIRQLKEIIASRQINKISIKSNILKMHRDSEELLRKKLWQAERLKIDVESLFVKDEIKLEDIVPKKVGDAYDLIVMGTHSRNRVLTAFLGSSARNLILRAPTPVIICKS